MEFLPQTTVPPPKNLFPCLATISIHPPALETRGRRLSSGSGEDETSGNALTRVISGGNRRQTSFGPTADWQGEGQRRKSTDQARPKIAGEEGRWYWRVQAGVNDTQLVLLPLSQPPNPLLTSLPAPLSQAMPSHSTSSAPGQSTEATATGTAEGKEGFGDKIKHLLHIGSHSSTSPNAPAAEPAKKETTSSASTDATAVDTITDQNAGGQQVTPVGGATITDANAESNWPGIIYGDKLGAIIVDLKAVDKSKVTLGQSKRKGWTVLVQIGSSGTLPLGREVPKTGSIKFEFDKEWIGAKGEAELLHFYITSAIENDLAGAAAKPAPQSTTYQLGSHTAGAGNAPLGEVAPGP